MAIEVELPELTPAKRSPPPRRGERAVDRSRRSSPRSVVTVMAAAMGALFAASPADRRARVVKSRRRAAAAARPACGPSACSSCRRSSPTSARPRTPGFASRLDRLRREDDAASRNVVAGRDRGDELAYLRTVTLSQIEGPIGLQNIRQDLNERAAIRSERQGQRTHHSNPGGAMKRLTIAALALALTSRGGRAPRPSILGRSSRAAALRRPRASSRWSRC